MRDEENRVGRVADAQMRALAVGFGLPLVPMLAGLWTNTTSRPIAAAICPSDSTPQIARNYANRHGTVSSYRIECVGAPQARQPGTAGTFMLVYGFYLLVLLPVPIAGYIVWKRLALD